MVIPLSQRQEYLVEELVSFGVKLPDQGASIAETFTLLTRIKRVSQRSIIYRSRQKILTESAASPALMGMRSPTN